MLSIFVCKISTTEFHCPSNRHSHFAVKYLTHVVGDRPSLGPVRYLHFSLKRRNMSLCVRKSTIWVPTMSDTNQAVQSQKMVRGWKFWIYKVQELYYPFSENKGVTAKLICAFVFAYADCWFSHETAHI